MKLGLNRNLEVQVGLDSDYRHFCKDNSLLIALKQSDKLVI